MKTRVKHSRVTQMLGQAFMFVLALSSGAHAESSLAPWFYAEGYYNKPGVDVAQATSDMSACRIEALRLKQVRNTRTQIGTAMAFNRDGSYNPVVSGAASGIASILFAIQDSRYNGSIEQIEFRDCAVSLGYRRFRLGKQQRVKFDASPDRGFAALVAAGEPVDGAPASAKPNDNYYDAVLVQHPYENLSPATPASTLDVSNAGAVSIEPTLELSAKSDVPSPAEPKDSLVARVGIGELATPQINTAIVVVSARQMSSMIEFAGDDFLFRRVTPEGKFIELLQPATSFVVRSYRNADKRKDPSLAGKITDSRYSTYEIPAGRYALSKVGLVDACLGTLTYTVSPGDVVYLGDFVLQPVGLPIGSLFNPLANIKSDMDNKIKSDLRVAIGDELETARLALQADDETKSRLKHVAYQNGFRIPCEGQYVGRVSNPSWTDFDPSQSRGFQNAMAAKVAEAVMTPSQ